MEGTSALHAVHALRAASASPLPPPSFAHPPPHHSLSSVRRGWHNSRAIHAPTGGDPSAKNRIFENDGLNECDCAVQWDDATCDDSTRGSRRSRFTVFAPSHTILQQAPTGHSQKTDNATHHPTLPRCALLQLAYGCNSYKLLEQ